MQFDQQPQQDQSSKQVLIQNEYAKRELLKTVYPQNNLLLYKSGEPGFPWLHGRDLLYSIGCLGYETYLLTGHPSDILKELENVLEFCMVTQGQTYNKLNGEEPGKIIHEDNEIDRKKTSNKYYNCDATALFLTTFERYIHLSHKDVFLEAAMPSILDAFGYILAHTDTGSSFNDLFVENPAFWEASGREKLVLKVTYWKDSRIPIRKAVKGHRFRRDEFGGIPHYPIAYSLVNAQNIAGLRSVSELFNLGGRTELAALGRQKAEDMKNAMLEKLWDNALGYFPIGKDVRGSIDVITSDNLHMLYFLTPGDIPADNLIRLLHNCQILETPIGYRTMDPRVSYHSTFPLSEYHSKTVWPFEQAIIALAAMKHRRWAQSQGNLELADELLHVQHICFRILKRMAFDQGQSPEAYVLQNEYAHSFDDPSISMKGCSLQLWSIMGKICLESMMN